jgi:hypothetical protein
VSWLLSIVVGLASAVTGFVGAWIVAVLCVGWYRVSSFEGEAGYFVVLLALLGMVVGFAVGIGCARIAVRRGIAKFRQALALGVGATAGLVLLAGLVSRLFADLPPRIDGHDLELSIELRGPKGFVVPQPRDGGYPPEAEVVVFDGRSQPTGELRLAEAKQVDGRWIVTATVPLDTSASQKFLRAYLNEDYNLLFPLPLRSHPDERDREWSAWVEAGWPADKPKPAPGASFTMRYRVELVEPPPPGPSAEEIAVRAAAQDEAKFQAVAPDAPIAQWLPYTRYGTSEPRLKTAIAHITSRASFVEELSALMLSADPEVRVDALRVLEHVEPPPAVFAAPVAEVGRLIAEAIRAFNQTTPEQDPAYAGAAAVSVQFAAWMVAVRALQGKNGVDLTPQLRTILDLARSRPDSYVMRQDVVRVASYYVHEWTGTPPLPSDPPPGG